MSARPAGSLGGLISVKARCGFCCPFGEVSALDAPGQPFWEPAADAALFETLAAELAQTDRRKLLEIPFHINHPQFAQAAAEEFLTMVQPILS